MSKKYPEIDLLIINYNGQDIIPKCLDSIFKKTNYPNYNVVVIENGSTDNSEKIIRKYKKVKLVKIQVNKGFAIGYNKGVEKWLEHSKSDYFLIMNNDIIITDKDWIKKLTDPFLTKKDIGITCGSLILPSGWRQTGGWMKLNGMTMSFERRNESRKDCYLDFPQMAAALVKKELWIKAQGLDEGYRPFLTEEKDFAVRARKLGYKIYYVSNLELFHESNATVGKVDSFYTYYVCKRNFIRFRLLHYPIAWIFLAIFLDYKSFLNIFILRTDEGFKFNVNFLKQLRLYLTAYLYNFLILGETINKRIALNTK